MAHWVKNLPAVQETQEMWVLPLLGARVQTAAGSALTVFYVGFETRPRGKQREFLLSPVEAGTSGFL